MADYKGIDYKVLVVDRDRAASQMLETVITGLGVIPKMEATKESALKTVQEEHYNIVFFDPLPQLEERPFIIGLRRGSSRTGRYVYAVPMSREKNREIILLSGGNEHLQKPIESHAVAPILENAKRFLALYHELKDQEEINNIYCEGSMLGNSAVAQVFLTAVDRADRYGEKAFFLNIQIENYADIKTRLGEAQTKEVMTHFVENLKRIRRQSDMIGRLQKNRFALIMQRPVNDREPADATNRLRLSIEEFLSKPEFQDIGFDISLRTISIPVGEVVADMMVGEALRAVS